MLEVHLAQPTIVFADGYSILELAAGLQPPHSLPAAAPALLAELSPLPTLMPIGSLAPPVAADAAPRPSPGLFMP
ncbi:hypothetical protein [Pseudomonas sp. NPDC007930]|uniref:hypothetical protein n=1 Tax=Pseudomonas sp. NPDC007930 TaxID=3364417 RepID=UPI0036EF74C3